MWIYDKQDLGIYADVMESTKKESLEKLSDFFDGKESDDANSTNYESKWHSGDTDSHSNMTLYDY